jgi:hypothetical protein
VHEAVLAKGLELLSASSERTRPPARPTSLVYTQFLDLKSDMTWLCALGFSRRVCLSGLRAIT